MTQAHWFSAFGVHTGETGDPLQSTSIGGSTPHWLCVHDVVGQDGMDQPH